VTGPGSTILSTPSVPHTSVPISAIVGGVVGGIAVISGVALIIAFLLCRRRRPSRTAQPAFPPAQPGYVQQQPPQMPYAVPAAYGSKHASYASGYPSGTPNSSPPMFQGSPQSQSQQGLCPPQNYSPHGSPVNPQAWYPPQQGSPQPAVSPMLSELPPSPAPTAAHEMPGS
jgi:hypothetical protein